MRERKKIEVVESKNVNHIDAFTAPRLVEYHDDDPCRDMGLVAVRSFGLSFLPAAAPLMKRADAARGVTVEARYHLREYDVLILSAHASDGPVHLLTDNRHR